MIRLLEPRKSAYDNPACYLRGQGCCVQKVTNEHPISEGVLRASVGDLADVIGPKWNKKGKPLRLRPQNLGSNVLCEAHNSAISSLDAEAKALVTLISSLDPSVNLEPPLAQQQVNGNLFERWIIKALVGALFSGITTINKRSLKDVEPPRQWIDWILGREDLPEDVGLIVSTSAQRLTPFVGLLPHYHKRNGLPVGATVTLYGLNFSFIAANYKFAKEMGPLRPRGLELLHPQGKVSIALAWPAHFRTTEAVSITTLEPDESQPNKVWETALTAQEIAARS